MNLWLVLSVVAEAALGAPAARRGRMAPPQPETVAQDEADIEAAFVPAVVLGAGDGLPGEIQRYLGDGLKSNPSLRQTAVGRQMAAMLSTQARLGLLPQVSVGLLGLQASRDSQTPFVFATSGISANASVTVLQGGASWRQLELAATVERRAELDSYEAEEELILRLLEAYYSYLSARDRLVLSQTNYEEAQRGLAEIRDKYRAGMAFKTDYLGVRAQVLGTEGILLEANESVRLSRDVLNRVLDRTYGTDLDIPDAFQPATFNIDIDAYRRWARENHAIVKAARLAVQDAETQAGSILTSFLPTVSAVASLAPAPSSSPPAPLLSSGPWVWTLGLQMSLPLPGVQTYYDHQQAQLSLQAARAGLVDAQNLVEEQVSLSMQALTAAARNVVISDLNVQYARENYRVHKAGHEEGLYTFDTVNRIYNELRSSEIGYYSAVRDHYIAWARLLRAADVAHNLVASEPRRGPQVGAVASGD